MKIGFKKFVMMVLAVAVTLITGISMGTVCATAATSISGTSSVSGMPDDFARGVDISALTALEKSGVEFHYLDEIGRAHV